MTQPMTPREKVELKLCPFCGGEPSVSTYETESLWSHDIVTATEIGCGECDVHFATEPGYELEAPAAWNRRAALASGSGDPISLQKVQTNAGDPDLQKMQFGGGDHAELARLAEAATPGPWDRMAGRGLVRAIRDDLAVPLFEPLEPYSDPLLDAPTCRVGGEVIFRANSQAARESAAIRQAVHNAAFIAAANPDRVLALIAEVAALRAQRDGSKRAETLAIHLADTMADRATEAERKLAEARRLLKPFADAADSLNDETRDHDHIWEQPAAMSIDADHLRAARTFLSSTEAERG